MSYFKLVEAAEYASSRTGQHIEASHLLRAGVAGVLVLCAPFGFCTMYNATIGADEDFRAGFLVIPASHLLEIETQGFAVIKVGFGLDKTVHFPMQSRTLDQLRVLVIHLDQYIFAAGRANVELHAGDADPVDSFLTDEMAFAPAPMPRSEAEHPDAPDLSALFDGVTCSALDKMFGQGGRYSWKSLVERGGRNGLNAAAKVARGQYNPCKAAQWWLAKQKPSGWDWAKCCRVLATNLPPRSAHQRGLLVQDREY